MNRQRIILALKVVLTLIVIAYVGRVIAIGWRDFRSGSVGLHLQWRWILGTRRTSSRYPAWRDTFPGSSGRSER
jgi:hypothetical protein